MAERIAGHRIDAGLESRLTDIERKIRQGGGGGSSTTSDFKVENGKPYYRVNGRWVPLDRTPTSVITNNDAAMAKAREALALAQKCMLVTDYDSNADGKVNAADAADSVPWAGITGVPATFPPSAHTQDWSTITSVPTTFTPSVHGSSHLAGGGDPITGLQDKQILFGDSAGKISQSGIFVFNADEGVVSIHNSSSLPTSTPLQINKYADTAITLTQLVSFARGSVASPAVVQTGDRLGGYVFAGHDGTAFRSTASIECYCEGTIASNSIPSRLVFNTTVDGGSSRSERGRFTNAGLFLLNNTTLTGQLSVVSGANSRPVAIFRAPATPGDVVRIENSGGTAQISVSSAFALTFADAANLAFGTTTGTKIGTATNQKLGFFNATPVVQRSAYTQTYSTASRTHANSTFVSPAAGATRDLECRAALDQLAADVVNLKQVLNSVIDDQQALGLAG